MVVHSDDGGQTWSDPVPGQPDRVPDGRIAANRAKAATAPRRAGRAAARRCAPGARRSPPRRAVRRRPPALGRSTIRPRPRSPTPTHRRRKAISNKPREAIPKPSRCRRSKANRSKPSRERSRKCSPTARSSSPISTPPPTASRKGWPRRWSPFPTTAAHTFSDPVQAGRVPGNPLHAAQLQFPLVGPAFPQTRGRSARRDLHRPHRRAARQADRRRRRLSLPLPRQGANLARPGADQSGRHDAHPVFPVDLRLARWRAPCDVGRHARRPEPSPLQHLLFAIDRPGRDLGLHRQADRT